MTPIPQSLAIVTDSTSCLPPELLRQYSIHIIPLHLIVNGKERRDGIDIVPADVYRILEQNAKLPTTSAVNPTEFALVFSELCALSQAVLYVSVSGALSATYECARAAAEAVRLEKPGAQVQVLDSRTCCGAAGLIAVEAARTATAGHTPFEAAERASALIPRVKYVCIRETLRYLVRMGRAPSGTADQLDVRQITALNAETGRVQLLRRVPQDADRSEALAHTVTELLDRSAPVHAIIHYSNDRDEGYRLKQLLANRVTFAECHMAEYSPLVTCASGPLLGIAFYQ